MCPRDGRVTAIQAAKGAAVESGTPFSPSSDGVTAYGRYPEFITGTGFYQFTQEATGSASS